MPPKILFLAIAFLASAQLLVSPAFAAKPDLGTVAYGSYDFRAETAQSSGLLVNRDRGKLSVQRFKKRGVRLKVEGAVSLTVVKFQPDGAFSLISHDSKGKVVESLVGRWKQKNPGTDVIVINAVSRISKSPSSGQASFHYASGSDFIYQTPDGKRRVWWSDRY